MSLLSPPPIQRGGRQPPDDVDALWRAFFQAQMPNPWPSLEAPPRRVAPPPAPQSAKGWPMTRSRLALAASVALLAFGLSSLAGPFQGRFERAFGPILKGTTAERMSPGGSPLPSTLSERNGPTEGKVKEHLILIQEPGGTTIKVDVIDWPVTPK